MESSEAGQRTSKIGQSGSCKVALRRTETRGCLHAGEHRIPDWKLQGEAKCEMTSKGHQPRPLRPVEILRRASQSEKTRPLIRGTQTQDNKARLGENRHRHAEEASDRAVGEKEEGARHANVVRVFMFLFDEQRAGARFAVPIPPPPSHQLAAARKASKSGGSTRRLSDAVLKPAAAALDAAAVRPPRHKTLLEHSHTPMQGLDY